jgi:hypothetical protein
MVFLVVVGERLAPAAVPEGLGGGEPVRRRGFRMIEDVDEHLEDVLGDGTRELAGVVWLLCHDVMSQRVPELARVGEKKNPRACCARGR